MKLVFNACACVLGGLAALSLDALAAKPLPADLMGGSEVDFAAMSAARFAPGKTPDVAKEKPMTEKIDFRLTPGASMDSSFVLSEGQVGVMCFMIKGNPADRDFLREVEKADRLALREKREKPLLVEFDLPAGVEILDLADGKIASVERTGGRTHYRLATHPDFDMGLHGIVGDYNWWRRMGFLLKADVKAGTPLAAAKGWMSWKGERISNVQEVRFSVMPAIPRTAQPKRFLMGCEHGGYYITGMSPEGLKAWTAFAVGCGLNGLQPTMPYVPEARARALEIFREGGIAAITPTPSVRVYNGYDIGDARKRPEADRFVSCPEALKGLNEAQVKYITSGSCPSAIYERRAFFRDEVIPAMRREFAGYDGIWCNWEPWMQSGRGCFCDTCRGKFAAFAGLSEKEMAAWPAEMTGRGRYAEKFLEFQRVEHGKVMRTLNEEVRKACRPGAKTGFVPGVAWCTMCSTWRTNGYEPGTSPIAYAGDFEWVSPWGPYAAWMSQKPYEYATWKNLRTFAAARDVRAQVNRDYPAGRRPKLMAYAHGYQCEDWVIRPEALEMNLDSFFFNGWEAASAYLFPKGYDARWWAAFARSAAKAAKYEDIVFGGRRIDDEVELVPTVPMPPPNADDGTCTRGLPIRLPMLQHVAYEKGGRTVVAVFNFWEKGPLFFRVKIRGRDRGELYCGALRTKVWEFGAGVKRGFTDADVAAWRGRVK